MTFDVILNKDKKHIFFIGLRNVFERRAINTMAMKEPKTVIEESDSKGKGSGLE